VQTGKQALVHFLWEFVITAGLMDDFNCLAQGIDNHPAILAIRQMALNFSTQALL
jgi:hypothetical protein